MGYQKKSWSDRQSEYPSQRKLTLLPDSTDIYEVTRAEGLVFDEGSAFDQQNMNDMENRIDTAFVQVAEGTLKAGTAAAADTVPWVGVTSKPASYPASPHSHTGIYTATLGAVWAGTVLGPWTQTVALPGILVTDAPVVDILLSGNDETDRNRLNGWGMVSRIATAAGSITATCLDSAPDVALPIQLKVVR